jgi:hypothetical protein
MTYIPPDARAASDFEILHGLGTTAYRLDIAISDANVATTFQADDVEVGDFLRCVPSVNSTNAFTLTDTDKHIVGVNYTGAAWNIDAPLGIAWDAYDNVNSATYAGGNGHPDANSRDRLTVLTGEFIAKVPADKFLDAGDLVPIAAGPAVNFTAKAEAIGSKVVLVNWNDGSGNISDKLMAIGIDYAGFIAGANPTAAETALMNAVVGQIVNIDGSYVHVRFSF